MGSPSESDPAEGEGADQGNERDDQHDGADQDTLQQTTGGRRQWLARTCRTHWLLRRRRRLFRRLRLCGRADGERMAAGREIQRPTLVNPAQERDEIVKTLGA